MTVEAPFKIAAGSLVVSVVVLAIKYAAYLLTGSIALYSDALESIVNVATAVAVLVSIRIAARPADAEHPYGHHKAEYLSAVVVGVMIVVAAFAILREAYAGYLNPAPIEDAFTGMLVSLCATLLNVCWAFILMRRGRALRSASLVADGKHLMADVATTIAVLAGVIAVVMTGIIVLDAIIAALVALHVLWSGWGVIKEDSSGLLDEAAPAEDLTAIRDLISQNAEGALEDHALRTRHAGSALFIDFHLVVPAAMNIGDAHDICDRIEGAIRNAFAEAIISIHVEPEHKAKHKGLLVM